jgi:hypothetical protein
MLPGGAAGADVESDAIDTVIVAFTDMSLVLGHDNGVVGDQVVDHSLNYARTERRLFDWVVTDYERLFEKG